MPTFRGNLPGLRVFARDGSRSYKFRAGRYEAEGEDAEEIRAFGAAHPHYGITEESGEPVETSDDLTQVPVAASNPNSDVNTLVEGQGGDSTSTLSPEGEGAAVEGDQGDADDDEDDEEEDLESLRVPELQELARRRGLAVGGNRAELIARLQEQE